MFRWAIAAGLAATIGSQAAAQDARIGRVSGLIVSGEGRTIPGVQIRFRDGRRVVSDARGRFDVEGLAFGEHDVILVSSRCVVTSASMFVSEADRREYHLTLPPGIAEQQREDMRARAEGTYLTADAIMKMRARRVIDVIRRVAPDMVGGPGVQPGDAATVRGRNRATLTGITQPMIVVDGAVLGRGDRILSDLSPDDVAAIEILKGAAGGWMYGSEGSGGVIRVWTKRGAGAAAPTGPDSCEVTGW